jgi:hypothetical protein
MAAAGGRARGGVTAVLKAAPGERAVARQVRAILEQLPETVSMAALERALVERRPDQALAAYDPSGLDPGPLAAALVPLAHRAARQEARGGTVLLKAAEGHLNYAFNVANPEVPRWAERHAGRLIVEIGKGTRDSIRALITRAVREGQHPYVTARAIRPLIGLHERWATAVLNYRYGLEAQSGVQLERVESLTGRYYSRLLNTRAETIARTETLGAQNAGKLEAWSQAFSGGLFGPDEPTKQWVAAPDAEPICAELDGTEVALSDVFTSELGDVEAPPLHPNCRCTMAVISVGGVETEAEVAEE